MSKYVKIEELYNEYEEYSKKDKHPLPYIIWLKHKKKVNTIDQVIRKSEEAKA